MSENQENTKNGDKKKHLHRRTLPKYLQLKELQELLATPYREDYRDRLVLLLMAKSGLRASEVTNLAFDDFIVEEKKIFIRKGKGNKDRLVPLPPDTIELFLAYTEKVNVKAGRLFAITVQGINGIVRKYAKKSGLLRKVATRKDGKPMYNIHPHTLRHSFAVYSLQEGINVRTLQMILGHSSLETTAIYLQLIDANVAEAYEKHPLPY